MRVPEPAHPRRSGLDVQVVVRYAAVPMWRSLDAGASSKRLARFFANGMLLNVIAAMGFHEELEPEPWALRLMTGCRETDA